MGGTLDLYQVDRVEPTHNVVERAQRPEVLWRKASFGLDTEAGSRFAERQLTLVTACHQQASIDITVTASQVALRGSPTLKYDVANARLGGVHIQYIAYFMHAGGSPPGHGEISHRRAVHQRRAEHVYTTEGFRFWRSCDPAGVTHHVEALVNQCVAIGTVTIGEYS